MRFTHTPQPLLMSWIMTRLFFRKIRKCCGATSSAVTRLVTLPSDTLLLCAYYWLVTYCYTGNNAIRRVSNGVIATVAGNGLAGFSGDNGLAVSAMVASPASVAVDNSGNLYIADGSSRVRKVYSSGFIVTIAGTGAIGYTGDGGSAPFSNTWLCCVLNHRIAHLAVRRRQNRLATLKWRALPNPWRRAHKLPGAPSGHSLAHGARG